MNSDYFDQMLDISKIRDRKDKWGMAMMLPEHVSLLREYYDEQQKVARPQLDEWDLEIIQENIEIGLKKKCQVHFKRWKEGQFVYNQGTIEEIDLKRRTIEIQDPFSLFPLNIDDIVDVTVLE